MPRLVFKLLLLLTATLGQAQTVFTGSAGVDAWDIHGGPARYLPDYGLQSGEWRSSKPWAQAMVRHEVQADELRITGAAQGTHDAIKGGYINRLDLDVFNQQRGMGARAGVLNYRMTWCRTYDPGTFWIAEPDVFCRFSGLSEMNQSAAGLQAYGTVDVGSWVLDGLVGTYRPHLYGEDNNLGPYLASGPTVSHVKRGVSVNALHLPTGLQMRAGFLRTAQDQHGATAGSWLRQMRFDSHYLALEAAITPSVAVRASQSAYIGEQINNEARAAFNFDGRSTTVEVSYSPVSGHVVAAAVSRYVNTTVYRALVGVQSLTVQSAMASYRRDFQHGLYVIAQVMGTVDELSLIGAAPINRRGSAVGLRVAKTFD